MGKKYFLCVIFISFQCLFAFATAQIPDKLIYNGQEYALTVNPMEVYFNQFSEKRPRSFITSLWRGYVATFEIIQDELWVIDIKKFESDVIDGKYISRYVSIINECLDGKDKMKIDWFKGVLVLPQGRQIEHIRMGYASTYEYYILLEIKNGKFIREIEMNNEKYLEFRGNQFKHYKQTDAYKKLLIELNYDGNATEEELEEFIRIFIIEYLEYIFE